MPDERKKFTEEIFKAVICRFFLNRSSVCDRIDLTKVKSIQLNSPDGELNVLTHAKLLRS